MYYEIAIVFIIASLLLYYVLYNYQQCSSGYVKLMMAPGDHCVLNKSTDQCGGHDTDFSDASHKQECVSKKDFQSLWKAGLCHYDDDTPIINKDGYVMCKPNPSSTLSAEYDIIVDGPNQTHTTVDGYYLVVNYTHARETGHWQDITVNGHALNSFRVIGMITDGVTYKGSEKVYEYLASLPGVDRTEFKKHVDWVKKNGDRGMLGEKYCNDLPDLCKYNVNLRKNITRPL